MPYLLVSQLNGSLGLRTVVWLQARVRGRRLGLYAGYACDDSAVEAAYAAIVALYKCTLPMTCYGVTK